MFPQPFIGFVDFFRHINTVPIDQRFPGQILAEIKMCFLCNGIEQIVVVIGEAGIWLKLAHVVTFHNSGDGYAVKLQPFVAGQIFDRTLTAIKRIDVSGEPGHFLLGHGLQIPVSPDVVLHLLQGAHTAETADDAVKGAHKTDGPGGHGSVRLALLQDCFHRCWHFSKATAFYRFHDDNLLSVLPDHIVAWACLHKLGIPVKVVGGYLYKFKFRVLGQNTIQQFRRGVEGESEMADLSFFFPFKRMFNQML